MGLMLLPLAMEQWVLKDLPTIPKFATSPVSRPRPCDGTMRAKYPMHLTTMTGFLTTMSQA